MADNKGFFDLTGFDEMADDTPISLAEGSEFASNSYAKTGADNHIPGKAGTEMGPKPPQSSTQPGETVKKPSGEGEKGPKAPSKTAQPGETTVKSVPRHDFGPKTPGSIEITTNEWNAALSALKKSYKESFELMEMLENVRVVNKSQEDIEMEYTENVMFDAFYESMADGPIFEAVERSDKNAIKSIVKKIRPKLKSYIKEQDGIQYNDDKLSTRAIKSFLSTLGVAALAIVSTMISAPVGAAVTTFATSKAAFSVTKLLVELYKTRLWQFAGTINIEAGNVNNYFNEMNKQFADTLGEYKLLAVKASPTFSEVFKNHFGWKNTKGIYFILIDKKLTSEMKNDFTKMEKALVAGKKKAAANPKGDKVAKMKKKNDDIEESFVMDWDDDMEEFTESKKKKDDDEEDEDVCPECGKNPCECDDDSDDGKKKKKKSKSKKDDDECDDEECDDDEKKSSKKKSKKKKDDDEDESEDDE